MHLPSKELLGEVLKISKYLLLSAHIHNDTVHYFIQGNTVFETENTIVNNHKTINIYELAHKCKEWALFEGHILSSWMTNPMNEIECCCRSNNIDRYPFQANTEPEAIFKACEWILENKDK